MKPILLLLLAFAVQGAWAQSPPTIDWQLALGGTNDDQLYAIDLCSDGGYILGGVSRSNISGDKTENSRGLSDYWIIKLDILGNIQWQKTIGGNSTEELQQIKQTSDGGYIIAGSSYSGISGDKTEATQGQADFWIVKLDSTGNLEWQNTIGGSSVDFAYAVVEMPDAGFLVGGYSSSGISGDKTEALLGPADFWVLKLDANGNLLWQNAIGGDGEDVLTEIKATNWGSYMLIGTSTSNASGDKTEPNQGLSDYWMVEIDSLGNIIRQKAIGGNADEEPYGLVVNTDGTYVLTGYSDSDISGDKTVASFGTSDYWTVKLDTTGAIIWQKAQGGNANEMALHLSAALDGGYLITGVSNSGISGNKTEGNYGVDDYWVVKTDALGDIEWQKTLGANLGDIAHAGILTLDGGFLIGGRSSSGIAGNKTVAAQGGLDYWLIKFEGDCGGILTNETASICDGATYTFNARILDSAGVYRDTLQSYLGCDSIVELNLSVLPNTSQSLQVDICQGDSIWFAGQYYHQAGIYVDSLQSVLGCDSVISLALNVNPLPNPVITDLGDSLVAGDFLSYQWFVDGSPINNANNPYHIPTQSGLYTVEVTDSNACSNLSSTGYQYFIVGNPNIVDHKAMRIYPNPVRASRPIYVELNLPTTGRLQLFNNWGQLVDEQVLEGSGVQQLFLDLELSPGLYSIGVFHESGTLLSTQKLIVTD